MTSETDLRATYQRMLNDDELARLNRFYVDDARDQFLFGRALLRLALSRHTGISPQKWDFGTGPQGKPHIVFPTNAVGVRFNISHTTGLVACAISDDWELGVDVECTKRDVDHLAHASGVLAQEERQALNQLPAERQRDRFFSLWTLKEAYVKARGVGFSIPLDAFWFDMEDSRPQIRFSSLCPDHPSRWQFSVFNATPFHKLALAVAAPTHSSVSIATKWLEPGRS